MRISVSQIYIKPDVSFPFSHLMQRWLSDELSSLAEVAVGFQGKYGPDYDLVVNISADTGIRNNLIKGPTVFKKTNDVEYTVFLPYDAIVPVSEGRRLAAEFLLAGVHLVFEDAGIDAQRLGERKVAIINHICTDATMLSKPWPDQ